MNPDDLFTPIEWREDSLWLLDQRLLPQRQKWNRYDDIDAVAAAIADLVVRGAPAIGITAAYGVVLGWRQSLQDPAFDLDAALGRLAGARPTAVNLAWAVDRQRAVLARGGDGEALLAEARRMHRQDIEDCRAMGDHGAGLIDAGSRVLTHCNAGALATGGYGTALGVIRSAWSQGRLSAVYASETRPWQQGLRLTAWELARDGIDVQVIVEGAASSLMRAGLDWVIVGADRVCANGDVVNKIGTSNLAILARHHGVRFLVAAPTSTLDPHTASGAEVPIETRDPAEILGDRYANEPRVRAWNPVFDVTEAALIDALVTEKGVVLQPDKDKIAAHLAGE